jgi:hypothetical protein
LRFYSIQKLYNDIVLSNWWQIIEMRSSRFGQVFFVYSRTPGPQVDSVGILVLGIGPLVLRILMRPLLPTRSNVLFRFLWWQRVGEGYVVMMFILLQGLDGEGVKVDLATKLVRFRMGKERLHTWTSPSGPMKGADLEPIRALRALASACDTRSRTGAASLAGSFARGFDRGAATTEPASEDRESSWNVVGFMFRRDILSCSSKTQRSLLRLIKIWTRRSLAQRK